jgi:hypothetical protein
MLKDEEISTQEIKEETPSKKLERDSSGIIPGVILIVLGILFLLPRLGVDFGNLWPTFLLAPGISFLIFYFFSINKKKNSGILIPAVILILTSFFFYGQTFSSWANAEKLWPIYPLIVGLSFYAKYLGGGKEDRGILMPANILTGAGLLFLVLNYYSFNLWPLILIIVGMCFILSAVRKNRAGE